MGTLVVVRHAQASLFADDYDVLSDLGREQARALGRFWGDRDPGFRQSLSGPALRHRETESLVGDAVRAGGARWPAVVTIPDLDEHDGLTLMKAAIPEMSAAEPEFRALVQPFEETNDKVARSRAFQQIFERVMGRWLEGKAHAPDVESWPAFHERVHRGLRRVLDLAGRGATSVVFTSVGPIAVLLQEALRVEPAVAFRTAWRLRNSALSTFVFNGEQVTLDRFNEVPHLLPSQVTFR